MRTTLNIDNEALSVIRRYADERRVSLGQATSDLVQLGAENLPRFQTKNGWVVFEVPSGAPTLTNEMLDQWEQSEHEEEHRHAISPRR